jgi:hypothetical protein
MKKNLFIIFFLGIISASFAQKDNTLPVPALPIDEDSKLVTYKEVVQQKGSPQELYNRAMEWIKVFYKNTGEVIKDSNRTEGVINMRSSIRIYFKQKDGTLHFKNIVYYNFKLECRQDRYRYTITDFNEKAVAAAPIEIWFDIENPTWDASQYDFLTQIDEQIIKLIESLEEGMSPKPIKNDDW